MQSSWKRSDEDWMLCCYQSWYCQRQCKRMKKADGAVGEYELELCGKREKGRRVNKARSEQNGLAHSVRRSLSSEFSRGRGRWAVGWQAYL